LGEHGCSNGGARELATNGEGLEERERRVSKHTPVPQFGGLAKVGRCADVVVDAIAVSALSQYRFCHYNWLLPP
jgi:hypothetical protein